MLRFLPVIAEIALLVFCLIDCVQSDQDRVRNLSKGWWLVLIVVLPIAGGVAWLVAGRPVTPRTSWSSPAATYAPDDRPRRYDDVAAAARRREEERRSDELHEQMLRDWEAQLREREQAAERDRTSDRDDAA